MKTKIKGILIVTVCMIITTTFSFAMGPRGDILGNLFQLNLSKDQKESLNTKLIEHRKEMIRLRADLEIAEIDLRDLQFSDKPDQNKIKEQISKLNDVRGKIDLALNKFLIKVRTVLSKKQWSDLKTQILHNRGFKGKRYGQFGKEDKNRRNRVRGEKFDRKKGGKNSHRRDVPPWMDSEEDLEKAG